MRWDIEFDMYLLLLPFVLHCSRLNGDFSLPKPKFARDHGSVTGSKKEFPPSATMETPCSPYGGKKKTMETLWRLI